MWGRTLAAFALVAPAAGKVFFKMSHFGFRAPSVAPPAQPVKQTWAEPGVYERTQRPLDEAYTLPGAVYHDDAFYKLEQEKVFQSSWVAAAELCDLRDHGDVLAVTIGGEPLLLTNQKGTIRAFHNVCRHRGAQLINDGEKCSKQGGISCPYHAWGYSLDGQLRSMPSFESLDNQKKGGSLKGFDKAENGLFEVRLEQFLGLAFVNLDGKAPPLEEWFGDLMPAVADYEKAFSLKGPLGGLTPSSPEHRKSYDIASNWKVLIENYLEYYHLPAVHPELCQVSGVDEHRRNQGKGMYMCFATDPLSKGGTPIDPGRLPSLPTLSQRNTEMAYHVALFPNTFFSLYPDAIFRVVLSPQSVGRTIEHTTLLTHDGARECPNAEALLGETYEFWDLINTQDIEICEAVHKGTAAKPYEGGRFAYRFEEPVHRFQNMVIDRMLSLSGGRNYNIPDGDPDYGSEEYHQPASHDLAKGTGKNAAIFRNAEETNTH